jgi:hypothetical protein
VSTLLFLKVQNIHSNSKILFESVQSLAAQKFQKLFSCSVPILLSAQIVWQAHPIFLSLFAKAAVPLGLWAQQGPREPSPTSRCNKLLSPPLPSGHRPITSSPPPFLSQAKMAGFNASCLFASPEPAYKRCHTSAVLPRAHLCYQIDSSPCRHLSRRAPPTTTILHHHRPFSIAAPSIQAAGEDPLSLLSLPT